VDFNVSHQAGIVSLIAAVGFKAEVDVGTDVTCWNERKKHDDKHIEKRGLFDWIDMHADVFAESEITWMKLGALDLDLEGELHGYGKDTVSRCERRGGSVEVEITRSNAIERVRVSRDNIIDAKLRRFYTMWCLREAYVKMTGEALLAPWLRELEIMDIQAPKPHVETKDSASLLQGEGIKSGNIVFKGKRIQDVYMDVSAVGQNFMIAGCVRFSKASQEEISHDAIPKTWIQIQLEDILP
jgi:4'-phosphopantetheinyl transferase